MIKQLLVAITLLFALTAQAVAYSGLPEFTRLIEEVSPAVVKINTVEKTKQRNSMRLPQGQQQIPDIFRHLFEPRRMPERNVHSMGSGFIVSSDGYILTNNHVIEGADEIQVRLTDRREFKAEVVGTDPRSDLALLKVDGKNLPKLTFADDKKLKVGEWVLAIGSPFGLDFSASAGIVSAIGRSIPSERNENYVPFIQTDVAINPGNSGGPLFNLDGEVVGINSQIYTRSGGSIGLSFAIPSSLAQNVIVQLKDKGRVDRGWLGVVIQEVDKDLAKSFGLNKPMGALVTQIVEGSPAADSKLKVGDVIVRFGKADIQVSGDLPHAVGTVAPGTEVIMEVVRQGIKKKISVEVGRLSGEDDGVAATEEDPKDSGGRLGLVVEPLDKQMQKNWQLSGGVVVRQVLEGSAGARAGILPGDVIAQLGFNGVDSVETYRKVEQALPANSLLPIRFFRRGRPAFRTITIEE
ncbi:MAG: serine protease MucD [Candidatus Pelagadaptatus aseana]|uniref:Do family serine endopeptidase n=1 Tax=Candidatus Pelagadaptatus aseana TaxID=3120508 RepID=UPI0039B31AFF